MRIKISDLIDCTSCNNYVNEECLGDEKAKQKHMIYGKQAAKQCEYFSNRACNIAGKIDNQNALKFMIAGNSEFIMISGKTNKKLRYKLDKKESNTENKVYWMSVETSSGEMIYGGVIFFDINDNTFKFGRGARGNLGSKDIEVISLLYVLNHLHLHKYNINVTIMHTGRCGKCGKKLINHNSLSKGLCEICENHLN